MIVDIVTPESPLYADVSRFARESYAMKLGAVICANPDAFAYACEDTTVVGCFGMYRADTRKKVLIERYVPNVFKKIADNNAVDRRLCAEIGTRAIARVSGFQSIDISLALSATLLIYAHAQGIRYIGFTANRTAPAIARRLGISLVSLGEPNLSDAKITFRKNWKRFLQVRQHCFGFKLESLERCHSALAEFKKHGVHSRIQHARPP